MLIGRHVRLLMLAFLLLTLAWSGAAQEAYVKVELTRKSIRILGRTPPAVIVLPEDAQIKIPSAKILGLSAPKLAGGAEAAARCPGATFSVAALAVPSGCAGCGVQAHESYWLFTPPEDLGAVKELQLPFTVQATCAGGSEPLGDAALGVVTLSLSPPGWDGPWCPQEWPQLSGVGVAVSVAFAPSRAANCGAAPFAGGAGKAGQVFAALVTKVVTAGSKAASGELPQAVATPLSICKDEDETNVGYGITQAVIDVRPAADADLPALRAALSSALHLANLCPSQPSTPFPAGAPAEAFQRFCGDAAGGEGRVAHFALVCVKDTPESGGPYEKGRAATGVALN